jgi:hypothetical protein
MGGFALRRGDRVANGRQWLHLKQLSHVRRGVGRFPPFHSEDARGAEAIDLNHEVAGNPGEAEGQAAATQRLRGIVARQQPRPARPPRAAIQGQPFCPSEVFVCPSNRWSAHSAGRSANTVRASVDTDRRHNRR